METSQRSLEGIIRVVRMQKIFVFTSPKGAVLRYFLPILCINNFFMFLHFLRTLQLLHINFFTDILGITQRIISLNKYFHSISPSSGSHFEVFWGLFWGYVPLLSNEILYRCFLYYSDSQYAKKIFAARIPLLGAWCSILGPILGTFRTVLWNLKYFSDI